jgi:hypothetical protein
MRAIRSLIHALACLVTTAGAVRGAPAAEAGSGSETNAPAVAAEIRHEEGPGLLPADRAYIMAGTNKFAFLVPAGFKLETWNESVVALVTRDYSSQIVFRLAGPLPIDEGELNTNTYSSKLLQEHPGAKIIKSFSAFADSHSGPAYEVELPGPAGSWRRGEIAFIPSQAAVLEFSLISSPEKFEAARQKLSTVMLTFRASDAHGELHVSPLSDKL